MRKMEGKEKTKKSVKKSCQNPVEHARRITVSNITLEGGWSPSYLIRQVPFWPADMRIIHARE